MRLSDFLKEEWRPALGCTEPASIAYAAACASTQIEGAITKVRLKCDPRIYKNCYAVGIPHSEHRVGIRWALARGALLPDPAAKLQCFEQITPEVLKEAERLLEEGLVEIEVDRERDEIYVECVVERGGSRALALIERDHTRMTLLEVDGRKVIDQPLTDKASDQSLRASLASMAFEDLIELARSASDEDRAALSQGVQYNLAIARHGLDLLPDRFVDMANEDPLTRISRMVCSGVHARMCGEDFVVMALAGSGNKGITCAVPLALFGEEFDCSMAEVEEALSLACLVTSATTHHLGTLSAVCGCSNAAGIGLAAGLVMLEGGDQACISRAVNNMVGNVTGMICDGAKIGCALKTMTAVDAAFRATSLAMSGIGIPVSDGIVGVDGHTSLFNMGRMATVGMASADEEILAIMQEKLNRS